MLFLSADAVSFDIDIIARDSPRARPRGLPIAAEANAAERIWMSPQERACAASSRHQHARKRHPPTTINRSFARRHAADDVFFFFMPLFHFTIDAAAICRHPKQV